MRGRVRLVAALIAAAMAASCVGIITAPIKAAADVTGDVARAGVGAAIPDADKKD